MGWSPRRGGRVREVAGDSERVGEAEAVAAMGAAEIRLAVVVGTGELWPRNVRGVSEVSLGPLN